MSVCLYLFVCVCECVHVCMCVCACVHVHVQDAHVGFRGTNSRSWFCPSTMWVPGVDLRWSGLVANTYICWAISVAHICSFLRQALSIFVAQTILELEIILP